MTKCNSATCLRPASPSPPLTSRARTLTHRTAHFQRPAHLLLPLIHRASETIPSITSESHLLPVPSLARPWPSSHLGFNKPWRSTKSKRHMVRHIGFGVVKEIFRRVSMVTDAWLTNVVTCRQMYGCNYAFKPMVGLTTAEITQAWFV